MKFGRFLFAASLPVTLALAQLTAPTSGQADAQAHPSADGYYMGTAAEAAAVIGPKAARQLEARLRKQPDDIAARRQLIAYYSSAGKQEARMAHILWLIRQRPEADGVGDTTSVVAPDDRSAEAERTSYSRAAEAWKMALEAHPKDTHVLGNAAAFFARNGADPAEAERLLLAAKEIEPANGNWLRSLTKLYMDTILRDSGDPNYQARNTDQAFNAKARAAIENSTRLGSVMCWSCHLGPPHATEADFLVKGAHKSFSHVGGFVNPEEVKPEANPPLPPRTDGLVYAKPELISTVQPVFPPKAKAAGVSGSVTLDLVVGTDGHVENVTVVRGHPVFTASAMDAARQYLYKPFLMEGRPTKVATRVDVIFQWVE